MSTRLIDVRQPRPHDLIASAFVIAGIGTAFEATVTWRVLDGSKNVLGQGPVQGAGSMGVLDDFGHEVSLSPAAHARGQQVTLQVFGDDPSGSHPPGTDLNEIAVTLFTDLQGWRLYTVKSGDNLTKIAHNEGQNTAANDIFQANRDQLNDPNLIHPGQVLRVPLRA